MDDEINYIKMPFLGFLGNLGHSHFRNFHYFDTETLFWSITRIFGIYYRIITSCLSYTKNKDEGRIIFLEEDIENFIIKFRIILNDMAYIIRQFYPTQTKGLKNPKGFVHPLKKEMSFYELFKFIRKNPDFHADLYEIFEKYKSKILLLKKQREDIIHYKSKVTAFYYEDRKIGFVALNPAHDEPREKTKEGEKVITTPVFDFINGQMLFLHNFINVDLLVAYKNFVKNNGWKYKEIGMGAKISCVGVGLFRKINKI